MEQYLYHWSATRSINNVERSCSGPLTVDFKITNEEDYLKVAGMIEEIMDLEVAFCRSPTNIRTLTLLHRSEP